MTKEVAQDTRGRGTCSVCGRDMRLMSAAALVMVHGPEGKRCEGSWKAPVKRASESAQWGEAHRVEAIGRGFELMAEAYRANGWPRAHGMLMGSAVNGERESGWRKWLARNGFDAARINREVRRVRALAEGRMVRETVLTLHDKHGALVLTTERTNEEHVRREHHRGGGTLTRVTRIRRASRVG